MCGVYRSHLRHTPALGILEHPGPSPGPLRVTYICLEWLDPQGVFTAYPVQLSAFAKPRQLVILPIPISITPHTYRVVIYPRMG